MTRLMLFWLLLAAASATAKTPCPLIKTDFTPAGDGLKELGLRVGLMAASPLLNPLNAQGNSLGTCASSFVSDEGHILTAGHCMENCLMESGALKNDPNGAVVDTEKMTGLTCDVMLNGKKIKVQVLAQSNCSNKDFYARETKKNCDGLDYSLIKPIDKIAVGACMSASKLSIRQNQHIAAIGYPVRTIRKVSNLQARDSKGSGVYVSDGQVIAPTEGCRTSENGPLQQFRAPYLWSRIKTWVEGGTIVQTDTDSVGGMSGGGVVDVATGQIIGIGNMSLGSTRYQECRGSTFVTSLSAVQKDMESRFPKLNIGNAFNCSAHSVQGVDSTNL